MSQPSASRKRRERERQELAERIMDAAREMFVRDGYEAVTLNRIAEAIEYTPGSIYQYFKDKRALVMAIIRADYVDLTERLNACKDISDHVERLSTMARLYVEWGVTHPNHYRLMTMPPPAWQETGRELEDYLNPPIENDARYLLGSFVAEGLETGLVKHQYQNPGLIAMLLWAGIHGVIMQEITLDEHNREILGAAGVSIEDRVNALIGVFLDGFLVPDWREQLGAD